SAIAALEHRVFRTMSDEADWVGQDVADAIERGVRPGDVAVIARAHAHLEPFAAQLKSRGVVFQRTSARGLYTRPEVELCLNVLRAVADPDDGTAVHQVLGHDMFGVDPLDLARLSSRARRRNSGLLAMATAAAEDLDSELSDASREVILRF